ncbi:hypothetical protein ACW9YQ_17005 (plasmid) [Paraburkholderia strydomiana]
MSRVSDCDRRRSLLAQAGQCANHFIKVLGSGRFRRISGVPGKPSIAVVVDEFNCQELRGHGILIGSLGGSKARAFNAQEAG